MSVRTASSTTQVLEDYKIHLTGSSSRISSPNSNLDTSSHPVPVTISNQAENPPNWPDNYRRIPAYRPADRNRGPAEIPVGRSPGERVFITVMFMGVTFNSVSLLPLLRLLCCVAAVGPRLMELHRVPQSYGVLPVGTFLRTFSNIK